MNIRLGGRALAVLAAAATVAALSVWHAGPASAVTAPRLVEAESASDTVSVKSARAECDDDEDVYGSGYYVRGGNGKVAVNGVFVQHQLWYVEVTAQVTDAGLTTAWSVVAQAVCGPHVEGLHRELKQVARSTDRSQSARVECATGQAYGGGFLLDRAAGNAFVNSVALDTAHRGVTLAATFDGSATMPATGWGITAYALCGPPAPVMTMRQTEGFEQSSASPKDEDAQCLSGTRAHGAGMVTGANSAADLGDIVVDQMRLTTPTRPLTSHVQAFENNATSGTWWVQAQLICAN